LFISFILWEWLLDFNRGGRGVSVLSVYCHQRTELKKNNSSSLEGVKDISGNVAFNGLSGDVCKFAELFQEHQDVRYLYWKVLWLASISASSNHGGSDVLTDVRQQLLSVDRVELFQEGKHTHEEYGSINATLSQVVSIKRTLLAKQCSLPSC